MQISETISVGIVAERRQLASPWADHDWQPFAVLASPAEIEPGTLIAEEPGRGRYYMGALDLTLHRKETESYRQNIAGSRRLYIMLRHGEGPAGLPVLAFQVTAAPDEALALSEVGDDVINGVTMPEPIAEWIADFVARFHVHEPKYKRKRKAADLDVFARRDAPAPEGKR